MSLSGRAALVALVTLAVPRGAAAFDVELDTDTSFQVYEVRSQGARAFQARRRLFSRLGIRLSHAFTEPDAEGRVIRLNVDGQLRFDQDFGENCLVDAELCVRAVDASDPSVWQPLAADTVLDVPSLWAEVNGLPLGFTARAGRQLVLDTIGFARFDGVRAGAAPLRWVELEAYAGLLVRGTSIAGTSRSDPQGSIRLDTEMRVPWAAPPSDTWVAGAAIAGNAGAPMRLRLAFRQMWDGDGDVVSRLSASVSSSPTEWLSISAYGVLDLLTVEIIDAVLEASAGDRTLTVRAAIEHHEPRFDPGTVWAWFYAAPVDRAELGVRWLASEYLELGGALRGRRTELAQSEDLDVGGEVYARAQWEGFRFGGSGFVWSGALGPLAGVALEVSRPFMPWLEVALDVSLWHFDDPSREDLYGAVVSESLSGTFRLSPETVVFLELTHAASRVVGHRFRGMLALRVDTWR
jgi:hypothetical protein